MEPEPLPGTVAYDWPGTLDLCTRCDARNDYIAKPTPTFPPPYTWPHDVLIARTEKHDPDDDTGGWVYAYYSCPTCGHRWRCGWALRNAATGEYP